jgi:hypothetical protein
MSLPHSKRLQLAANELSFIAEEVLGKLHMEEEVSLPELHRLEDAIEGVKGALLEIGLEEGLVGGTNG